MSDALSSTEPAARGLPTRLEPRSGALAAGGVIPAEETEAELRLRQQEYAELVVRCQPNMERYACKLLGSSQGADDVVQDVLLAAWTGNTVAICGRDRDRIMGYLIRSVSRRVSNVRRGDKREREGLARVADEASSRQPRMDGELKAQFARDVRGFVRAVLDGMDPKYAMAYELVILEGAKYKEAAETLGISLDTVKAHVRRANQEVLPRLAAAGYDSDGRPRLKAREDKP